MDLPSPRPSGHAPSSDHDDATARERFLSVWAALYDHVREASRHQLDHATTMAELGLGGTVWIQVPSRPARRPLPEAGYISDIPAGVPIG